MKERSATGVAIALMIGCVACGGGAARMPMTSAVSPNVAAGVHNAAAGPATPVASGAVAGPAAAPPLVPDAAATMTRPTRPGRSGLAPFTAMSVTLGDATADRVLSFEVTITSIVLNPTSGAPFPLFTGSRRIEATHLAGTFLPINLTAAPQGTYTSADITVTSPDVVFVALDKTIQKKEDKTLTRTVTINFSPALTVGTTAVVLNLDLNVAASLLIDTTSNAVTVNPTVVAAAMEANENEAEPEKGELEHVVGTVTAVDTMHSQFSFAVGQSGSVITVTTDSLTKFEIGDSKTAGLEALAVGMQVRVEGKTKADGRVMATEVEATAVTTGAEAEGIITKVTGDPATQLAIIAQDGTGMGISNGSVGSTALLGSPVAVNIADKTKFLVDARINIDSSVFPFDAKHVKAGQRVEAESQVQVEPGDALKPDDSASTLTTSGAIAANKIKLEPQALVGTVSSFTSGTSGAQFVLTVDADSVFALLSGSSTVAVSVPPTAQVKPGVTLPPATPDTKVRVRGWVFFDGAAFKMIALRVTAP